MSRPLFATLLLGLIVASSPVMAADSAQSSEINTGLPKIKLDVGGHVATAEVAATPPTRSTGLMNRFSIPPDEGMVFVFPQPQPLAFWMRNTYAPLSIAFIDANGRILNIEDMAPRTEVTHESKGMALYTLEMRQGWFARNNIEPGTYVKGLPPPSRE